MVGARLCAVGQGRGLQAGAALCLRRGLRDAREPAGRPVHGFPSAASPGRKIGTNFRRLPIPVCAPSPERFSRVPPMRCVARRAIGMASLGVRLAATDALRMASQAQASEVRCVIGATTSAFHDVVYGHGCLAAAGRPAHRVASQHLCPQPAPCCCAVVGVTHLRCSGRRCAGRSAAHCARRSSDRAGSSRVEAAQVCQRWRRADGMAAFRSEFDLALLSPQHRLAAFLLSPL